LVVGTEGKKDKKSRINPPIFPPHVSFFFSFQMPICSENVCNGSVVMPSQQIRKPDEVRTKEELLPLATDFMDQYYTSIKRQVQPVVPKE